ncbi:signal transduction histidine kinase [Micromonospora pisi]|uniref:histidine kinase n=1 Tax=Micromonospora pisi TaxID=589240 RepID=A0A495JIV1_9ACTN|nr:nitrate- and nitrite sensing domain-containing protein [Micromonospora pisi]RKR88605.1 signal transduction histidine kinase [Micromonospora pisi]
MSKQPNTANSLLSRLRRPMGRLRDMPIWSKLGIIMIVPTLATIVVGTTGLIDHLRTYDNAERARTLAHLAQASGQLVDGLQDERAAAVLLLGVPEPDREAKDKYQKAYSDVHPRIDDAKGPYSEQRAELSGLPANFTALLTRIDRSLADLPGTRSQVVNGKLKLTDASQSYEGLISDLLDIRDSASQLAGDSALSERMRAAAATSRAKEFLSVRRVVVHRALQYELTPVLRTEYIATETGQQQALQSFQSVATRSEAEFYEQTVAGSDQREADNYSGYIRGKTNDDMSDAPFDADKWDAAMVGNAKLIRTVEAKLDGDAVARATEIRDDVRQQVFVETTLLLATLLLAILFAWIVARSMARSLRELRHGALSIAQYGLPQAVARLRDPALSAQMSPVQLANQIAEPLPVRGKDEFGQVTEAFNAVHLEAVRTAAEQAALRSSVATMFVNLARRSQILVDRLIGHLDRLERGEEDPDRLAELFQLDHLATRMRRNDENLLVLAGADSTRVQREPAALIDVLRAAQSEVEHYTRIEFGVVDRDIEVAAHAVNDLVHLVAELFDNATAFSPPDSQVMVEARRVGDRASLYVEDRGIGITADQLYELNERLATPPQVDVAVSRMMGLVVVARLAARHGVKVELRPGSDRGTVADVTMPTSVLVPRALSGRAQQSGGYTTPAQQPPSQRPNFGAPLALESSPVSQVPPAQRAPERDFSPTGRPFEPAALNGGGLAAAFGNGGGLGTNGGGLGNGAGLGNGNGAGRGMPAWSDLTGAKSGGNGTDGFSPRPSNGQGIDPLPQRRATESGGDAEPTNTPAPNIPRQMPSTPEIRPANAALAPPALPPVSAPPISAPPISAPPVSSPPVSAPPMPPVTPAAGAPPAWPPVSAADREAPAPSVPERLAAALDMTAELPRVVRPPVEPPITVPSAAAVEARPRFADETMELPIFRELESAWFRTRRAVNEENGAGDGADVVDKARYVTADTTRSTVQNGPSGATAGSSMAAPVSAGSVRGAGAAEETTGGSVGYGNGATRPSGSPGGWQTAADDGWRAASAATAVPVAETTQKGLPKRVPMAQLVPGGVEKPSVSVQRRTPEAVRGLLSAYHRGVQRGRTNPSEDPSTNPEATPGQQSPQAGLGPAAGSGQKEHEA